ncbi:MAG: hypothetical protein HYW86_02870 [Candidatus Roizmanbacteria bacterium]|nr:MAG: hypothetical protein HYW86_02870 [Candidatus Roizmanbacteria bacterium]
MEEQDNYFEFSSYELSYDRQIIKFHYKLGIKDKEPLEFIETITLPVPIADSIPKVLINSLLQNLHLMLGISYWKIFCQKNIRISSYSLTKEQAEFWNTVYTKGLGEFFYRNEINFKGLVNFPYSENANAVSINFERQNRSLVGLGGGKDSLVTIELLKEKYKRITAFILETQRPYPLIQGLINNIGIDSLTIKRQLDPQLFEANKMGGAYNGHVPISAIYAFVGLLAAVVYDYRYVIVSNEKSANIGNVEYFGQIINHQWSKSEEFERLFQNYTKQFVTPNVYYFSLIRPLSEMKVTEIFSKYDKYFKIFSSCNNNFRVGITLGLSVHQKWCGSCPKCAFVFSMMAAFLPKTKLVEIFGRNLFADQSLMNMYKDLLGIGDIKPFECVGTFEESKAAFYKAYLNKEYEKDAVMQMFEKEVLPNINNPDELIKKVLSTGNSSMIPEEFK